MNIYLLDPRKDEQSMVMMEGIADRLNRAGCAVSYRVGGKERIAVPDHREHKLEGNGLSTLEAMDGFIIESSQPDRDVHYCFSLAVIQKKPVLGLYERGKEPRELLSLFRQKNVPDFIQLKSYTKETVEKTILTFLPSIEAYGQIELPTIKFTVRITRQIERYLHWKSAQKNISKADFIRDILKHHFQDDDKYQKYLKKS